MATECMSLTGICPVPCFLFQLSFLNNFRGLSLMSLVYTLKYCTNISYAYVSRKYVD